MSWYNPATWFIDQENLEAGNRAAEQLKVLNQQDYGAGGRIYEQIEAETGKAAADETLATVLQQGTDQTLSRPEAEEQVNKAFLQGWNEAYAERTQQAKGVLSTPFKVLFDTVPWYFWLIGAIALYLYLGGGPRLKKLISG